MSKVKLGDVCTIQSGGTPARSKQEYWNGSIPWVKISDLNSKYLYSTDEFISEEGLKNSSAKIFPENSILFTIFATLGEVAILKNPAATNQAIAGITINDDSELDLDYLYYFLLSLKTYVNGIGRGVAQNNINMSILKSIEIPVLSIGNQRKIAYNLDIVNHLIELCNNTLEKLDTLVKSRFVEMFGDPVLNTKKWEIQPVINECKCMVPGRDKPKSFTGNIPWITIDDLIVNGITYCSKQRLGLTKEEIKQVNRKTIPVGSVIMSCVGNLGICSIAGTDMIINQQLHSFQCGDRINPIFLMYNLTYRKDYMNKWASNTTVLYMNKTICNSIPIMLPPIELQDQFADFVAQIEKQKETVKKSLEKLETLKKALMQEYFRQK